MNLKNTIQKKYEKESFEETEDDDLMYWASLSIKERLMESLDWNKRIWTHINGTYPEVIEKTGGKFSKKNADEDDF